jgi:hypothetical protein
MAHRPTAPALQHTDRSLNSFPLLGSGTPQALSGSAHLHRRGTGDLHAEEEHDGC